MISFPLMMELDEILATLVSQVDGATAAAVGGMDGLLVERYPPQGRDLTAVAAELTDLLGACRAAIGERLGGGPLREVIVITDKLTGYARVLTEELFCLVVLESGGNIGKARLYGERAARHLLAVLG